MVFQIKLRFHENLDYFCIGFPKLLIGFQDFDLLQYCLINDMLSCNDCIYGQYFCHYHPDHLGSSSFITDASGAACEHLQYMPFGETFVSQRASWWSTPYQFSAKEKDEETGFSYFGARYYNSDVSVWLSVDPLSDKYPSMSAYMYCAGNPVMLVDPDGRWIKGAGLFRNVFKSDQRIKAEDKVKELKKQGYSAQTLRKTDSGRWGVAFYKSSKEGSSGEVLLAIGIVQIENQNDKKYYNNYPANLDPNIRREFANMRAQYMSHNEMNQSLYAHGQRSNTGTVIGFGTALVISGLGATLKVSTGPLGLYISGATAINVIERNRIDNEFWSVLNNYYGTDPTSSKNKDGVFITHTSVGASYGGGYTYIHYFNARTGAQIGTVRHNW